MVFAGSGSRGDSISLLPHQLPLAPPPEELPPLNPELDEDELEPPDLDPEEESEDELLRVSIGVE